MKVNAKIICRRNEGYGTVCEWEGPSNGIARAYRTHELLDRKIVSRGEVFSYGRLRLRIVQPVMVEAGAGYACDAMAVMLESPHAQLYQLYREKAEIIVRLVMRFEAAYNAFRFQCNHEGRMPFTSKVADLLL